MNIVDSEKITELILNKEQAASQRWNNGDCTGYLETYRDDITFADPTNPRILNGKEEVKAYFDATYLGIKIEKAEWSNVHVAVGDSGDMAILTYNQQNYIRSKKDGELHKVPLWSCTEVYRLTDGEWKIAHANWSFAQHPVLLKSLQELFIALGYLDQ